MKKYLISIISLVIISMTLNGQIVDTAYFQLNYVPYLQNFEKINSQVTIIDTVKEKVKFDYYITPQTLPIIFSPTPIAPQKLAAEPIQRLYRNFIKVGFGYPITPLAELAIHNGYNKSFSYGLNVHHFSSWAPPIGKTMKQYPYYPFSDTKTHLFLTKIFKKQTLYSSIDYNHFARRYYGFKLNETADPNYYGGKEYADSLKTHFHHLNATIGVRSNYTVEERALKQDVQLNYNGIFTKYKDMENHIGLKSFFAFDERWMKISGSQLYRLNLNFDYFNNQFGTKEDSIAPANTFLLNPEILARWTFNEYHILVGLGIGLGVQDETTKFLIYPLGEVKLGVIPHILSLYAGVDGTMELNSYQKLLYENPFIKLHFNDLQLTKNWIHFYGGVKGNLIKKLNYNIFAQYTYAENMLFFVRDTLSVIPNQFDVAYDKGGYLNVGLNVGWNVERNLNLDFYGNYWLYHLTKLKKPWYKPMLEFGFKGEYYFKELLIFNANFQLGFGYYEQVLDKTNPSIHTAKLMKPILDFGIGTEWLITKQFSAFVTINNIGCQYYAKYSDYKNMGINALIGVTYSFGEQNLKRSKRR
jgi:hypothetical protein